MIRQIVFDMGDVLLRFDTRGAAAAHTDNPADAELLHQGVFQSPWWISMDRGGDEGDALRGMLRALPQRLHEPARRLMAEYDRFLTPNTGVNALAEELDGNGYGLYLLSNTSRRFPAFQEKAPAMRLMRGKVLSFEEGVLKPDPAIYRRLFDRYGLTPEECFFIDDAPANIEAAWSLGMKGHCFRGDVAPARRDLREMGVDIAL